MSDAIKWMVRQGYEDNPGSGPATSSPTTTRRSATSTTPTCRPSSRSSGRTSWSPGPAASPTCSTSAPRLRAGSRSGPTHRLDDGIDLPCIKIGEGDEIARWHLERCAKQTRAPMYYLLDERTRLAGCHMVREAVERVILEEGVDRFRQFSPRGDRGGPALVQVADPRDDRAGPLPRRRRFRTSPTRTRSSCRRARGATS